MNASLKDKQIWLVLGTWALVLVSLCSTWVVKQSYTDQLKEIQKTRELTWRPFLNIDFTDYLPVFNFRLGESKEYDTISRDFKDVRLNSEAYVAVKTIGYSIFRRVHYWNTGATPLRIKASLSGTLARDEWIENNRKSHEELVRWIQSLPDLRPYETDVTIFPDEHFRPPDYKGIPRRMFKETFQKCLHTEKSITVYPYTFVEYEDFFGHEYNALLIKAVIIPLDIVNDLVVQGDSSLVFTERYRWDVTQVSDADK